MAKSKFPTHIEPKLNDIEYWLKIGHTQKYCYEKLGISKETWFKYKNDFSDFSDSVRKWQVPANKKVADKLFKRTQGYRFKETTKELNPITNKMETTKIVTKEIPPDVKAQVFWLTNRDSENWQDKKQVESKNENINKNLDVSHLSDEELEKEIEKLKQFNNNEKGVD